MICNFCAYENFPYLEVCQRCNGPLQSKEDAAVSKERWDRMPNDLKLELSARIEKVQGDFNKVAIRRKKYMKYAILLGVPLLLLAWLPQIIIGISMGCSKNYFNVRFILVNIGFGLLLGFVMFHFKTGRLMGLIAGAITFIFACFASGMPECGVLTVPLFGVCAMLSGGFGWIMGFKYEFYKMDHS